MKETTAQNLTSRSAKARGVDMDNAQFMVLPLRNLIFLNTNRWFKLEWSTHQAILVAGVSVRAGNRRYSYWVASYVSSIWLSYILAIISISALKDFPWWPGTSPVSG